MRPSRCCQSSSRAAESSGRPPGSPATSPTSAETSRGSTRRAGPAGGQLDRPAQLVAAHRPDQDLVGGDRRGEFGVLGAAPVEVGAHREHDDRAPVGVGGALEQGVDERLALGLVATGDEDLLELVDEEHEPLAVGQPLERIGDPRRGILASGLGHRSGEGSRQLRQRARAGAITTRRHRSEPGTTPSASAGSSPARTAEDLPLPDGPTTASRVEPTRRATSSAVRRSRPKKYSACAASNGASPRKGQARGLRVARRLVDRVKARALVGGLKVDDATGDRRLVRAQLAAIAAARPAVAGEPLGGLRPSPAHRPRGGCEAAPPRSP